MVLQGKAQASAEGGAQMRHQVARPTPRKGGAPLFSKHLKRTLWKVPASGTFEACFEQWKVGQAAHKQAKPLEDLELRKEGETLPPLEGEALRKAAATCKLTTAASVDGFHLLMLLDLPDACNQRTPTILPQGGDGKHRAQLTLAPRSLLGKM